MAFRILLSIHVLAGAIALGCFWIPLVTVKGGKAHRRVGWAFVASMAVSALTAWVICAVRFAEAKNEYECAFPAFFAFIALLATTTSWSGLRALHFKNRAGRHLNLLDLGIPLLLLASGAGVLAFGIRLNMPVLMGFAPVGIVVGALDLAYWLRPPQERMHWWFHHMANIGGTCIATLTAFLVNNVKMFGFESPSSILVVFLAPTLVGVPGMQFWQWYYRVKFRREAQKASPDGRSEG